MRFESIEGLIWVSFELVYEGKVAKIDHCILDTGSATTAIDIDLVEFNYRKPATIKRLWGIGGGTQEVVGQVVDKIILDQKELKQIEIEFGDIQADLGINGFIGNNILSHYRLTIDFKKREITFR